MQSVLTDTEKIEESIKDLVAEIEIIEELVKKAIIENTVKAQDQDEFTRKFEKLESRHNKALKSLESLEAEKKRKEVQAEAIGAFMFELMESDEPLSDFDERLWVTLVDKAVVKHDGTMTFIFKSGTEITI